MISTKGRYAMRLMLDLGRRGRVYTPLREVSKSIWVDLKYLEQISAELSRAGFLLVRRGSRGGYMLSRPLSGYTVEEVLTAAEGTLAPVSCLERAENTCPHRDECPTLPFWKDYYDYMLTYLRSQTLQDVADGSFHSPPAEPPT